VAEVADELLDKTIRRRGDDVRPRVLHAAKHTAVR
jgi:hypothetical protein